MLKTIIDKQEFKKQIINKINLLLKKYVEKDDLKYLMIIKREIHNYIVDMRNINNIVNN